MKTLLEYPFNPDIILRKKRSIKKELLDTNNFIDKRIAILGGSTTSEIKDILELFLLKEGVKPEFYESEYNKYYEDIMFPNQELDNFNPDIIYIHTTSENIGDFPGITDTNEQVEERINTIISKFRDLWNTIQKKYNALIIQNNFELPFYRIIGNLDSSDIHGKTYTINILNQEFARATAANKSIFINDINYLSAWIGLEKWYDRLFWHSYKYAMSYSAIPYLSYQLATIIYSIYGKTKKCITLDLDNTLWGGIIGDDGLDGIKIGKETPTAEAYTEFQEYLKEMKNRGIILSVCSKNDEKNAKEGFAHPDSILKLEDFSCFVANWDQKSENLKYTAKQINIGLQSIVFIDDNPAEREIVRGNCHEVAVPEVGSDVLKFINIIDKSGYFEPAAVSNDDFNRASYYRDNAVRADYQKEFADYGEYLALLDMVSEIDSFRPVYLERITQLTNKTNQFNLTTKRYTYAEMEAVSKDPSYIKLYGKMQDKFGDNGLISVIIGKINSEKELHIDLWLMSCRVIKRDMELAMFDALVRKCQEHDVEKIIGYYYPTEKNNLVSQLLEYLGFEMITRDEGNNATWRFTIPAEYYEKNKFIKWSAAHDEK